VAIAACFVTPEGVVLGADSPLRHLLAGISLGRPGEHQGKGRIATDLERLIRDRHGKQVDARAMRSAGVSRAARGAEARNTIPRRYIERRMLAGKKLPTLL
jgi:hypothetical protein